MSYLNSATSTKKQLSYLPNIFAFIILFLVVACFCSVYFIGGIFTSRSEVNNTLDDIKNNNFVLLNNVETAPRQAAQAPLITNLYKEQLVMKTNASFDKLQKKDTTYFLSSECKNIRNSQQCQLFYIKNDNYFLLSDNLSSQLNILNSGEVDYIKFAASEIKDFSLQFDTFSGSNKTSTINYTPPKSENIEFAK